MKKILLSFLLAAAVLASLSAETLPSEDFRIKGYYSLSNTDVYDFKVWLSGGVEQVFHAGVVTTDQDAGSAVEIFTWTMEGNSNKTITLSFKITPLQGYIESGETYYIPKHRFDFYQNPTVTYDGPQGGNVENPPKPDPFYVGSDPQTADFPYKRNGSYPYPQEYQEAAYKSVTIVYSGSVTGNNSKKWSRSGFCKLTVSEYEQSAGIYQYISYITVELTVK